MKEKHLVRDEQTRNRSTKKQIAKPHRRKMSNAESISTLRILMFDASGERIMAPIIPITRITGMRKAVGISQFVSEKSRINAWCNMVRHHTRIVEKRIEVFRQDVDSKVSFVWTIEVKRVRKARKTPTSKFNGNRWKGKRITKTSVLNRRILHYLNGLMQQGISSTSEVTTGVTWLRIVRGHGIFAGRSTRCRSIRRGRVRSRET
jgi:hypothetical protein